MTAYELFVRAEFNCKDSKAILQRENCTFIFIFNRIAFSERSMMAGRLSRSNIAGRSLVGCWTRDSMGDNFIYCIWNFLFCLVFLSFFYSSLAPNLELGSSWPPIGIATFDPVGVPLLNRVVLLSSGVSVTWAHHRILSINHSSAVSRLAVTIALGLYFTCLQGLEYWEAPFRFRDGAYGRVFFIATGFHGLHVLVGSLFLIARLVRLVGGSFRHSHHTGLEVAAWYWHFVDVVWLFLYLWVYVWAAN